MKKCMAASILVLTMIGLVFAAEIDIEKYPSCTYCGMNRAKFAQSRMLIEYEDGTAVGVCSLRCAAVDLINNLDKTPRRIGVGDQTNQKLIDAEKAVWVLGGNKPGVMTSRAKWAFATSQGAEGFIKEHGGTMTTFEASMNAACEDLYQDTRMIRERRKMKRTNH